MSKTTSSRRSFKPVDMTVGEPWKQILAFTIPMLIGNIAQQLYNTVDSIVVGRYVGDNALAAVGSAGPILNLIIVLFIGIGMGSTIMVSQYFGARDRESLSYTIGNSITLTLISGVLVTVIGIVVARPLLEILNTPAEIIDWCTSYLWILFGGSIGMAFFNIISGILRGLGDAISALIYLVISTVINIVLDLFFVAKLGLGVNGVALATIIAQGISGVLCMVRLSQMKDLFDMGFGYLKWKRRYGAGIIRLGLPSGITQAILSMSMIIVQSLTNQFGAQFVASNVIVMRVDGFAMLPNFSFGTALTTYVGQNVGAGRMDRVTKGARQGLVLSVAVAAALVGLILLFGRQLMGIFTTTDELIDLSMHLMRILAIGYVAMGVIQTLAGVMRGAGDTVTPMWLSILQTIGLRVPLAYLLCYLTRTPELPKGRSDMIYWSLMLSWLIGAVIHVIVYKRGKWKGKAVI